MQPPIFSSVCYLDASCYRRGKLTLTLNSKESDAERLLVALWLVLEEHDLATPLMDIRSANGSINITLTFRSPRDRALALAHFADSLLVVRGAVATSETQAIVAAATPQETRDRIRRWRQRAEELRTAADQYLEPSAQGSLRRSAGNLEQMADHAEALLDGKRTPPVDKAG
jgi:hypothetical protein